MRVNCDTMEYDWNDCSSEREAMINSRMLMTLFYGIYSSVFWKAITMGLRKGGSTRYSDTYAAHCWKIQRNPGLLLIAIFMYSLVTAVIVIHWKTLYDVFGPNGGNGTYLCTGSVASALPIFCDTVFTLNIVLADLVLIWRTYVVFGRVKRVVIFPGILVLCTASFVVYSTIIHGINAARAKENNIYELVFGPGECVYAHVLTTTYFGFSMMITLYCSLSITARIFKIRRLAGTLFNSYATILEVVTESAAFYTTCILITSILVLISPDSGSPHAIGVLLSVTGIAPTWILARVISGKARTDESWTILSTGSNT